MDASWLFAAACAVLFATGCTETVVACAKDGSCPAGNHCVAGLCQSGTLAAAAQPDVQAPSNAADTKTLICDPNLAGGPSPRGDLAGGFVGGRLAIVYGDDGAPVQCQPAPHATEDVWWFDPCQGWQAMTGTLPPPRTRAASASDAKNGFLYVYGGRYRAAASGAYTVRGDLWRLDGKSGAWLQLNDGTGGPPARSNAVLALRPGDGTLVLHGGNSSSDGASFDPLGDVWTYQAAAGAWSKQATTGTAPAARLFHAGAITADDKYLVIFAGGDANAFQGPFFRDVWRLDLTTWAWQKLQGQGDVPMGRIKSGLLAVPGQARLLLFGGHDDGSVGNRNDLWWLDPETGDFTAAHIGDLGAANDPNVPFKNPKAFCDFPSDFTQIDKEAPERREAFLWDYDPATKKVWMFGGQSDCGDLRDVWTLDPATLKWEVVDDTPKGWSCERYLSPCSTLCN